MIEYITQEEYFKKMFVMGQTPNEEVKYNARDLLKKVNRMLNFMFDSGHLNPLKDKIIVSSGWRTQDYNVKIGGAKRSNHITGQAIDLSGAKIIQELEENENILPIFKLFAESSMSTVIKKVNPWTHIQSVPPRSNKSIFIG